MGRASHVIKGRLLVPSVEASNCLRRFSFLLDRAWADGTFVSFRLGVLWGIEVREIMVFLDVINFTYCHTLKSQQGCLRLRELRHVTNCVILFHCVSQSHRSKHSQIDIIN